jgi:hypothetical protein
MGTATVQKMSIVRRFLHAMVNNLPEEGYEEDQPFKNGL